MGDKTFNQVEIKLEITLRHSTLYKTTMVLPLHRQGLASYVVKDSTSRQPIHTTIRIDHVIDNPNKDKCTGDIYKDDA